MTIKLILVPLSGRYDPSDPESLEVVALEAGFKLGRELGARVRVFCIEAPTEEDGRISAWFPDFGIQDVIDLYAEADKQRRERTVATFEQTTKRLKVPRASKTSKGFAVEFIEAFGEVPLALASEGKLADLIVVARGEAEWYMPESLITEVALRETARPVMIFPPTPCETIGKHIAIAWNGSTEATRATTAMLDLLARADKVSVLSIVEDDPIEPDGEHLTEYLARHGITASTQTLERETGPVGTSLLALAARSEADLLIMGAYTRGRGRRLLFGGATRHVLREPTIPVVMMT